MGLPRKRKSPRWTSEMVEIPASRDPKDPPEKRDCCKPKPKPLAPLRITATQQTVTEESAATANGAALERVSVSVTCTFAGAEAPHPTEIPAEQIPIEDTTAEEPAPKKTKLSHDPESADFREVWGSPKRAVSPNSGRNKDMLWSLNW